MKQVLQLLNQGLCFLPLDLHNRGIDTSGRVHYWARPWSKVRDRFCVLAEGMLDPQKGKYRAEPPGCPPACQLAPPGCAPIFNVDVHLTAQVVVEMNLHYPMERGVVARSPREVQGYVFPVEGVAPVLAIFICHLLCLNCELQGPIRGVTQAHEVPNPEFPFVDPALLPLVIPPGQVLYM